MKVFLHSDGALMPLIPSLIEMGVDILNPIQTSAKGMDARVLKEKFGEQLVFWGGSLDCQKTLPFGTPEEVKQEVKLRIDTVGRGGGLLIGPSHVIEPEVPWENVLAMVDEWKRLRYPRG